MKTLKVIIAFFQALIAMFGFGILSVVSYSEIKSPYNIVVGAVILLIGLYLSKLVFNMVRRKGLIDVLSENTSSSEIDQLEPTSESSMLKMNSQELKQMFNENKLKFKRGVTIAIWGDNKGRALDINQKLSKIDFNKNILTFRFSSNCNLKVKNPTQIFYTTDYLKILNAKEVLWETLIDSDTYNQYSYLNTGKQIITKSNTNWKPHTLDLGIGMNAIYLQG